MWVDECMVTQTSMVPWCWLMWLDRLSVMKGVKVHHSCWLPLLLLSVDAAVPTACIMLCLLDSNRINLFYLMDVSLA
jgi:hypothetical protein